MSSAAQSKTFIHRAKAPPKIRMTETRQQKDFINNKLKKLGELKGPRRFNPPMFKTAPTLRNKGVVKTETP